MIRFSAQTHPGKKRDQNEDAVLALPEFGLFVVADGVGGRAAGEVASALTIETFQAAGPRLSASVRACFAQPPAPATASACASAARLPGIPPLLACEAAGGAAALRAWRMRANESGDPGHVAILA